MIQKLFRGGSRPLAFESYGTSDAPATLGVVSAPLPSIRSLGPARIVVSSGDIFSGIAYAKGLAAMAGRSSTPRSASIRFGDEGLTPGSSRRSTHREREMEWMRTHRDRVLTYSGQWVVLDGDEIVAHGTDLSEIVAVARRRGISVPYVFYVEPGTEGLAKLGL